MKAAVLWVLAWAVSGIYPGFIFYGTPLLQNTWMNKLVLGGSTGWETFPWAVFLIAVWNLMLSGVVVRAIAQKGLD
jgi:hypothetical protein